MYAGFYKQSNSENKVVTEIEIISGNQYQTLYVAAPLMSSAPLPITRGGERGEGYYLVVTRKTHSMFSVHNGLTL